MSTFKHHSYGAESETGGRLSRWLKPAKRPFVREFGLFRFPAIARSFDDKEEDIGSGPSAGVGPQPDVS